MAISDLVSKILLEVRSDTTQAKADLKSLKGVQKEVFQSQLDSVEAGNKALDKWVGRLGQIGVALGAVKLAFDSVQEYGHKLDLQAASAGVSIDGLRKASLGLKTEMELLEHAARMNNSAFKLTQDQMEDVERAMYVLEERGNDSKEVWAAIDKAITTGATKPLEQFGIIIDKTGLALDENGLKVDTFGQKQEALRRVMQAVAHTAEDAKDAQHDAADAMQVELVKLNDFWHEMKMQLAQVVIQLTPVLKGLADAVSLAAELVNSMPNWMKQGGLSIPGISGGLTASPISMISKLFEGEKTTDFSWQNAYRKYGNASTVSIGAGPSGSPTFDAGTFATFMTGVVDELERRNKKGKAGEFNPGGYGTTRQGMDTAGPILGFSTSLGASADTRQFNEYGVEQTEGMIIYQQELERTKALTGEWMAELAAYDAKAKGFLETALGPIEQFDAYNMAAEKLGATFSAFGNAVAGSYEAIVTGQGSVSAAFKKIFADGLMAMGKSSVIEALRETALGFGSLALGPIGGVSAAMHFKSAALHAAVAVAAGAAAKGLGTSAQVSAEAKAASEKEKEEERKRKEEEKLQGNGGGRSGSSGSGGAVNNYTIVYGETFYQQSLRMQQLDAERFVRRAVGSTYSDHS
jgi:hypothetical protein